MSVDPMGNVIDAEGVDSPSAFSLDYYRNKVIEFQRTLDELDKTFTELIGLNPVVEMIGDDQLTAEYETLLDNFLSKRSNFQMATEAIQFASSGLNRLGVQFPSVQLPAGLSAPVVPLAAAAAAIAAAAALMAWAKGFWNTVSDFARRAQQLDAIKSLPPADQSEALARFQKTETDAQIALATAEQSPLTAISSAVKWAAFAGVCYLIYQVWSKQNGKS